MNDLFIESMNILIIDDSNSSTSLLTAILQKENFGEIHTSHTFESALEKLENFNIDLILLSYIFPNISGTEICSKISHDLRYEDIPIIMVTANTDINTLKSSFQHGASDYIEKPIKAIELVARVQSHLIRKHINDERKQKAVTDALTGLYNRRYFDTVFEREYNKAIAEKRSLTFFMLDIDNFKKYNDNYGHQMGDIALQMVSSALKDSLKRVSDYLFRIGGEEFVILLYDTNQEFINELSTSIHLAIEKQNIEHNFNAGLGRVSISIGIATIYDVSKLSKYEIYNEADEALYQAKEDGRNRSFFITKD